MALALERNNGAKKLNGHIWQKLNSLMLFCVFILSLLFSSFALAECTDSRVKRLSRQGKTVASISRTCDMPPEDVRAILDEEIDSDSDSDPGPNGGGGGGGGNGMPSGAPLSQCGCWGAVYPGMRQPNPQCQSGYAMPVMCNVMCPAGGFAWRGVCG